MLSFWPAGMAAGLMVVTVCRPEADRERTLFSASDGVDVVHTDPTVTSAGTPALASA
jgi:hypothetical protein